MSQRRLPEIAHEPWSGQRRGPVAGRCLCGNASADFLGDSITDFWSWRESPWQQGQRFGAELWDQSFGPAAGANRAMNMGTSGDRLEHVLPRLLPQAAGGLGLLDLHAAFLEREGQLIPGLFTDGLHRNEAGYRVWRNRRNRQVPLLAQQRHRKTS